MTTATIESPADKIGVKAIIGATAETVFVEGGVETMLAKISNELRPAHVDLTTKSGRDAIASAAYKVSRAATVLDDIGKDSVAALKKRTAAVDLLRRTLRDGLATLKDEIREPLTTFETTEKARVDGHEAALSSLPAMLAHVGERTSGEIEAQIAELGIVAQRDWQEYEARAVMTIDHVRTGLRQELVAARWREAERAELEVLRAKAAERERQDHERRIAEQAAADATMEASRQAAAARQEIEDLREAAARREELAEANRIAAQEQAEREKQQAIDDEREAVAANERLQRQLAEQRAKNKAHAAKINNEVLDALTELLGNGLIEEDAKKLIVAIARGKIPHTSISY